MKAPRIGLLPQGGARWIAGVVYLQNLVRACRLLPPGEQPEFHVLEFSLRKDVALVDEGDDPLAVHRYTHCEPSTLIATVTGAAGVHLRRVGQARPGDSARRLAYSTLFLARALARSRGAISRERLVRNLGLSAVFPVQDGEKDSFAAPAIGWIPDFQHKRLPHFFSAAEREDRDEHFRRLIANSSHVVVSSSDAYADLQRWFGTNPERVSILRFCTVPTSDWWEGDPVEVAREHGLPERFLMFPSQFWAHKNHGNLLRALAQVKAAGLSDVALVCTGATHDYRRPGFMREIEALIEQLGLSASVFRLGLLPRQRQIQLMRRATAIIQPSYFEGWSSLVEDCRTLGKRIYLSDIPVHREQQPPDATFFDPDRPDELASALVRDWPHLSPGPDAVGERRARGEIPDRARRYARDFLAMVARAEGLRVPQEELAATRS